MELDSKDAEAISALAFGSLSSLYVGCAHAHMRDDLRKMQRDVDTVVNDAIIKMMEIEQ